MDRKKIVFFLGSMKRGGAERVISILSKEYAKSGWDTNICVLLFNEVGYDLDASTQVLDFTCGNGSRILRVPKWIFKIRRYLKKEKPDAVVSFAARINILVLLANIGINRKIIISERNDPKMDGRGIMAKIMTEVLYPLSNTIVFQTKRVQSYFNKRIQKKSVVIPNPIYVSRTRAQESDNKIVTVGRLTPQKNHKMLLDAFSQINKLFPYVDLYVYGEGELKEDLENQARELLIENHIYFEGNVSDIHNRISDASFFVLPSDYEGLSNALLEAMMMGLPCISTDCAGSDEYIENNKTGLLVPVGDMNALKEAMYKFIVDTDLRKQCGIGAEMVSAKFSAESVLLKWHEIID